MNRTNTARTIQFHLADRGWSLSELARRVGISRSRMNEILTYPEDRLNDQQLARIADALEVEPQTLKKVVKL